MIQSDHSGQRERLRVTLQKWLEQDASATWNTLELAISNAHREELNLAPLKESKEICIVYKIYAKMNSLYL